MVSYAAGNFWGLSCVGGKINVDCLSDHVVFGSCFTDKVSCAQSLLVSNQIDLIGSWYSRAPLNNGSPLRLCEELARRRLAGLFLCYVDGSGWWQDTTTHPRWGCRWFPFFSVGVDPKSTLHYQPLVPPVTSQTQKLAHPLAGAPDEASLSVVWKLAVSSVLAWAQPGCC